MPIRDYLPEQGGGSIKRQLAFTLSGTECEKTLFPKSARERAYVGYLSTIGSVFTGKDPRTGGSEPNDP
jgi:hypothetical protein